MKNKASFYKLSFTWGIIMTLTGLIIAAVLICAGYKPKRWGGCLCFTVGKGWGGVSFGIVMIVSNTAGEHTKNHEFGHALQNCRYGLAMPILSLLSAARYWYRNIRTKMGLVNKTDYDDFWFEGEASELGEKYIKCWGAENG